MTNMIRTLLRLALLGVIIWSIIQYTQTGQCTACDFVMRWIYVLWDMIKEAWYIIKDAFNGLF
jgi:hypothetical protein